MEVWTDRIAALTLPTIVISLAILTAMRVAFRASRIAVFVAFSELIEACTLAAALVFLLLRPFLVQSFHIPTPSMRPTLREGDHILVNKFVYRFRKPAYGEAVVFLAPSNADPYEREFIKRCIGVPGDIIEVKPGFVQVGDQRYYHAELRTILEGPRSVEAQEENGADSPPLHLTADAIWFGGQRITPEEFASQVGAPARTAVYIRPGLVFRNGQALMEDCVAEDPQYRVEPMEVPPGELFVLGDNRNQSRDSHEWGTFPMTRIIGRADAVFWPPQRIKRIE